IVALLDEREMLFQPRQSFLRWTVHPFVELVELIEYPRITGVERKCPLVRGDGARRVVLHVIVRQPQVTMGGWKIFIQLARPFPTRNRVLMLTVSVPKITEIVWGTCVAWIQADCGLERGHTF